MKNLKLKNKTENKKHIKIKGKKIKFNNKKVFNFLINAFLILFFLYPIITILDTTEYLLPSVIIAFFLIIVINYKNINLLEHKKTIWIITIAAFLIRLIYVIKINNNIVQVSDFGNVFNTAKTLEYNISYYQYAYHYFLYTFLNGMIYKIFGGYQIVTLILNTVILSIIPILLFKICQKIFKLNTIGNLAAILYSFWPSLILYTAIMSPDHLALFFLVLSIYLILILLEKLERPNLKKDWIWYILTGISISLIGFFKNFSPVILIALLIVLFLICLLKSKLIKISLITFFGVALSFIMCTSLIFFFEESVLDAKIMKNQFGQYIYVGLGYSNKGVYNRGRYMEYQQLLKENNMDVSKTNEEILEKLLDEIKMNFSDYPELLKYKTTMSFTENSGEIYWIKESLAPQSGNKHIINIIEDVITPINENIYIIIVLFMVIGSAYNVWYLKNNRLLLINITIYGCALLLIFAESQNRYKYAFLPLFCIMAATGIFYGKEFFRNLVVGRKEIEK